MTSDQLNDFGARYAKAWCSQNPESVAAFFAENASLTVNGGPPTPALEIARGFGRYPGTTWAGPGHYAGTTWPDPGKPE